MKSNKFDLVAWAKQSRRATGGVKCYLCSAPKRVQDALATIVQMRESKQTSVSQMQVCRMLEEKFGFTIRPGSLARHVSAHMGRKW